MKRLYTTLAASLCAALTTPALHAQQGGITVLTGARVLTAAGPPIEDGVVVIAAGKIRAVGPAGTALPAGAKIVDCSGKVITPGLVDSGTQIGLTPVQANEQGEEVTPQVHILDAIDPTDTRFDRARRSGVTTLQVAPGNRNVIGGLGVVLKNRNAATVRKLVLREESGLRVTMGSEPSRGNRGIRGGTPTSIYARRPSTRMGVVWTLRKAFYDAIEHREQKTVPEGDTPPEPQPGLEILLRAIDKDIVVQTTARAEHDIRTALRMADEFGYDTLIEGGTEAWRLADELAAAGVRVMMSSPSSRGRGAAGDGAELRLGALARLANAGVPFAIQTGAEGSSVALIHEAIFATRNGLDESAALTAVTKVPAEMLGVDERVGSLAVGKDADLVIWTGSPFDPTSRAESVYIDGAQQF